MQCFRCDQRPTVNFGNFCQECKDLLIECQKEEEADEKRRTWNGNVYSGECMCGSQNKDVWLIQFNESGLVGMQGTVTGGWCMDCIYKMTGEREIDALPVTNKSAIMVFREIENICFIKKLREPTNLDKVSLDAIEVLKSVDF